MVTPPLESANRAWESAENSPGFAPKKQQIHSIYRRPNGMPFGLLFTAQPQAPAFMLAGASGRAVNEASWNDRGGFRFWLPNASPPRQAEWRQQVQLRTAELIRVLNRRFSTGNSRLTGHWLARHGNSWLAGLLTWLRLGRFH
jgi:hypothetical protein